MFDFFSFLASLAAGAVLDAIELWKQQSDDAQAKALEELPHRDQLTRNLDGLFQSALRRLEPRLDTRHLEPVSQLFCEPLAQAELVKLFLHPGNRVPEKSLARLRPVLAKAGLRSDEEIRETVEAILQCLLEAAAAEPQIAFLRQVSNHEVLFEKIDGVAADFLTFRREFAFTTQQMKLQGAGLEELLRKSIHFSEQHGKRDDGNRERLDRILELLEPAGQRDPPPTPTEPGQGSLTIVHLSDLHFGNAHRYPDAEGSYQTLLEKLSEDFEELREKHGVVPNAVVVTGDLTHNGLPSEFEAARTFLTGLRKALALAPEHVVVVPGNRDVNPDLFRGAKLVAEAEQKDFKEPYFAKFGNYRKFVEQFYDGQVPFHEGKLHHVFRFDGAQVLVAGLNSCLKVTDQDQYGYVGVPQVREAERECDRIDPRRRWLRIAALHHNYAAPSSLDVEGLRDADEIEPSLQHARFSVILHGHQLRAGGHRRGGVSAKDWELLILGAGSAGLDSASMPDHPNQYQIIDIQGNEGTLYMRRYSAQTFGLSGEGKWVPDTSRFDTGATSLVIDRAAAASHVGPQTDAASALEKFLVHVRDAHRFLPLQGTGAKVQSPIELEPVYVSLRALAVGRELPERPDAVEMMHEPEEILPAIRLCEEKDCDGLVILGSPGSGKTTLLRFLAYGLAGPEPDPQKLPVGRIPLFLPLRSVASFRDTVADALRNYYPMGTLDLPADFFENLLESGGCLLLFDGLDEVADQQARLRAIRWIEKEVGRGRDNTVLVTSRFAGYRGEHQFSGEWTELTIQDFRPEDRNRFIRNWYHQVETQQRGHSEETRALARDQASNLIDALEDHPDLGRLARNPLMLSIICMVNRTGTLPRQKTKLYEKCMDVLLDEWDRSKGMDVLLSGDDARQVLRGLALWLHSEEGRTHAHRDEVKDLIRPRLAEVRPDIGPEQAESYLERTLTSVRERGGVIVGYDVDQFGFQHLSFQEFLAADEIVKESLQDQLLRTFGESWWKEVCLLALGMDDPRFQRDFYEALFRSGRFDKQHDFAIECARATRSPRLDLFYQALIDPVISDSARTRCLVMLREIAGPKSAARLLEVLNENRVVMSKGLFEAVISFLRGFGVSEAEINRAAFAVGIRQLVYRTTAMHRDGTELITIPAGGFIMGNDREDREKPQRRVYLDMYQIGRNPVTNAQYRQFIEATGRREPRLWDDERFNQPNQPVVGVSWHDAQAYCQWAGLRLPTEAEWEKAARGNDGQEYPWGPEPPDESRCNFARNIDRTTEVGSYPDGASPYGCLDMAGNVWEWCADWYEEYDPQQTRNPTGPVKGDLKVLRGGSWYSSGTGVRCAFRFSRHPDFWNLGLGFRCAR